MPALARNCVACRYRGTDWSVETLLFSPDGTKIAVVYLIGLVELWDTRTLEKLTLKEGERGQICGDWSRAATFSSDGRTFLSATREAMFQWDVASGKLVRQFQFNFTDEPFGVYWVALSPDGRLAATRNGNVVYIFDTINSTKLHIIEDEIIQSANAMAFSPDGATLAVVGFRHAKDGGKPEIGFWSMATGKKIRTFSPSGSVRSLAFSPDGKTLASANDDNSLQLWNCADLKARPRKFDAMNASSVTFSPDGKTLGWGCGHTFCLMDRTTGKDILSFASHRGTINALTFLPNGKRLASAGDDGTIRIWDSATGKSQRTLRGHVGGVNTLALSNDSKRLVSRGEDDTIRLWDPATGENKVNSKYEGQQVSTTADYWLDGTTLDIFENILLVIDKNANVLKSSPIFEHKHEVGCTVFSPDGRYLVAISNHSHNMRIFETATFQEIHSFKNQAITRVAAFSPDGKTLASGGLDSTAVLWDLRNLSGKKRSPTLSDKELAIRWHAVSSADPKQAYESRADLFHAPGSTVPFLGQRLKAITAPDGRWLPAGSRISTATVFVSDIVPGGNWRNAVNGSWFRCKKRCPPRLRRKWKRHYDLFWPNANNIPTHCGSSGRSRFWKESVRPKHGKSWNNWPKPVRIAMSSGRPASL